MVKESAAIKNLKTNLKTQTTMETKSIKLDEIQALTILHLIEDEVKNVMRDKHASTEYKDYQLKELRKMHDIITNTFNELY